MLSDDWSVNHLRVIRLAVRNQVRRHEVELACEVMEPDERVALEFELRYLREVMAQLVT